MHVPPKPIGAYPWYVRLIFWAQRRRYGRVLDPALLWGRAPRAFLALTLLLRALDRKGSPVPADLRALILVRVSQLNHCAFCVDMNSATLLKRGVGPEKVAVLHAWRESPLFDDRERAVLAYAEAVTTTTGPVDGALIEDLRRHFDDDGLVELTGLIAFQNMSTKFNSAFDVPSQGFCRLPGLEEGSVSAVAASGPRPDGTPPGPGGPDAGTGA